MYVCTYVCRYAPPGSCLAGAASCGRCLLVQRFSSIDRCLLPNSLFFSSFFFDNQFWFFVLFFSFLSNKKLLALKRLGDMVKLKQQAEKFGIDWDEFQRVAAVEGLGGGGRGDGGGGGGSEETTEA